MREGPDRPLYTIGVAAGLVACHPQTLRQYEDLGLLSPHRTEGNVRLYSDRDIGAARLIRHYTQALGINRAGVEQILRLRSLIDQMRSDIEREFHDQLLAMQTELEQLRGLVRVLEGRGRGWGE